MIFKGQKESIDIIEYYFDLVSKETFESRMYYHMTALMYANSKMTSFNVTEGIKGYTDIDEISPTELYFFQASAIPFYLEDDDIYKKAITDIHSVYENYPHLIPKFDLIEEHFKQINREDKLVKTGNYYPKEIVKEYTESKFNMAKAFLNDFFKNKNDSYMMSVISLKTKYNTKDYCLAFPYVDINFYLNSFNDLTSEELIDFVKTYEMKTCYEIPYDEFSLERHFRVQKYGINIKNVLKHFKYNSEDFSFGIYKQTEDEPF